MKLTSEQQSELLEEEELLVGQNLYTVEDVTILGMDSHGYNVNICTVSCLIKGKYRGDFGFKFRANSDEKDFDTLVELVRMDSKEVLITKYTRRDGKDW